MAEKRRKYRRAVFAAVYRKNKGTGKIEYLLLKRKLHWKGWEFPKGGIKTRECLLKAVKRETWEEAGLKPEKIRMHDIKGKFRYKKMFKDRPGIIGQSYTLFSAQVGMGRIKIDKKEHSAYLWLPFNAAVKKLAHRNQKKCLMIVNNSLNQKTFRVPHTKMCGLFVGF